MAMNMKELTNQGIIAILFGGSFGIFAGFFLNMSEESDATHKEVMEIRIRQEADRVVIIDSIAELQSKIDMICNAEEEEGEWEEGGPTPEPFIVHPHHDPPTIEQYEEKRGMLQEKFDRSKK